MHVASRIALSLHCLDALHSADLEPTLLCNASRGAAIIISNAYLQMAESMQCKPERQHLSVHVFHSGKQHCSVCCRTVFRQQYEMKMKYILCAFQGAAIAAAICAQQSEDHAACHPTKAAGCSREGFASPAGSPEQYDDLSQPEILTASSSGRIADETLGAWSPQKDGACKAGTSCQCMVQPFKFAILCSGYLFREPEHRKRQQRIGQLQLPSLHVYNNQNRDRQIGTEESLALQEVFGKEQRVVVTHNRGHVMPVHKQAIAVYRNFLQRFL